MPASAPTDQSASLADLQAAEDGAAAPVRSTTSPSGTRPSDITPPAKPAEPESSEPPAEPSEPSESDEPDSRAFVKRYDAMFGTREGERLLSDDDLLRSHRELRVRLSQRDQNAVIAQALRQRLGDERVADLLKTEQAQAPKDDTRSAEAQLPPYDEYQSWHDQVQEALKNNESVPLGLREKIKAADRAFFESVRQFPQTIGEMEKRLVGAHETSRRDFQQQTVRQREEVAVQDWYGKNAEHLFKDEEFTQPTALGERFAQAYHQLEAAASKMLSAVPGVNLEGLEYLPGELERLDLALKIAHSGSPPAQTTKPVSRHAMHEPSSGAKSGGRKTLEDLVNEGMGLAEAARSLMAQED